ncbi:MAG TPA: hypothetical protein VER76_19945, partial [Pyrinomonadaceae bacterium]|nr:hypothetical protein [Pyrinomonadaceae bacterium]
MTDVNTFTLQPHPTLVTLVMLQRAFSRPLAILCALLCAGVAVCARQQATLSPEKDPTTMIIEGESAGDVFGMGHSVVVRGTVKHGVMAFGGDVVVEGRVEGDVGVIGGTITQR